MLEITITLFDIDELSEPAQARAVESIRQKLDGPWWDIADSDDLETVMIATLAEKLDTPDWENYGVADFPGIDGMAVVGWDISRNCSFAVTGILTRDNAPALPWVDGIDQVVLTGHRSDGTTVTVCDSISDCACSPTHRPQSHNIGCPSPAAPLVTDEQRDALEQAVRDALHDAWAAGSAEHDIKTGEQWAREVAGGHQFTEDGALYP